MATTFVFMLDIGILLLLFGNVVRSTGLMPCAEFFGPTTTPKPSNVPGAGGIILRELHSCEWSNFVAFTDTNSSGNAYDFQSYIRQEVLLQWQRPFVEIELSDSAIDEEIPYLVHELYELRGLTNYLITSSRAAEILKAFNVMFAEIGISTLMPQKIKLIVVTNYTVSETLSRELLDSVYDNIAIFTLEGTDLASVYTVMWRQNRVRDLDYVLHENLGKSACNIFPNVRHGLNQRRLVGASKEWIGDVTVKRNDQTGQYEYIGFAVDVMDIIADSLNFTYTLTPKPGCGGHTTWEMLVEQVVNRDVDFGLSLWPLSSTYFFNHTVTFPVLYDQMVGAYIYKHEPNISDSPVLGIFQFIVYICIMSALIFTIFLYSFLEKSIWNPPPKEDSESEVNSVDPSTSHQSVMSELYDDIPSEHFETFHNFRFVTRSYPSYTKAFVYTSSTQSTATDSLEEVIDKTTVSHENEDRRPFHYFKFDMPSVEIVFGFIGSMFNQGSLPAASSMSARFLLWSWSFMLVMLSAIYTGSLTAGLIKQKTAVPFSTVPDMLDSGEYAWGVVAGASILKTLQEAEIGSTWKRFYDNVEAVEYSNNTPFSTRNLLTMIQARKLVVFFDKRPLLYLKNNEHVTDMVIMEDTLIDNNLGFIMSPDSELTASFSKQISLLMETGILKYLSRKWELDQDERKELEDGNEKQRLDVWFVMWAVVASAVGIGIASMVLAVELTITRVKSYCYYLRQKERDFSVTDVDI
ncbi:uncharacterized protein LOC118477263 [Aplysia californica]|uniref:Uncharacterized protein LOC118477263 n=1 Tax=Aplysia californica TaxID=6500 RepID=A0ABM1VPA0_APLCA|nr:uncharacterized protein LOC118477263 [Aplysia californica]